MSDPFLQPRTSCGRKAYPSVDVCPAVGTTGPGACYQCGMDDAYDRAMKDLVDRAETDAVKRTASEISADFEQAKEELRQVRAQLESYKGMLTRSDVLELTKPLRLRQNPPAGARVEKLTESELGYLHGLLKASGVY